MSERDPHPAAPRRAARLVVPLVLAVTVAGTIVAAMSATTGCGKDKPTVDAGHPDTPLV